MSNDTVKEKLIIFLWPRIGTVNRISCTYSKFRKRFDLKADGLSNESNSALQASIRFQFFNINAVYMMINMNKKSDLHIEQRMP